MKKKSAASKVRKKSTGKKTAKAGSRAKKKTTAKGAAKKTTRAVASKKKTTAKKTTAKKKTAKKTTAKKTTAKKSVKTKTTAGKRPAASKPASRPVSRPVAPMTPPAEPMAPSPSIPLTQPEEAAEIPSGPGERPIGTVNHYYSHLGVAVVQLNDEALRVGDTIHIKGHTTDLRQSVESIEIDHQSVQEAAIGQVFGLKVRDHVREHDQIYKIRS